MPFSLWSKVLCILEAVGWPVWGDDEDEMPPLTRGSE